MLTGNLNLSKYEIEIIMLPHAWAQKFDALYIYFMHCSNLMHVLPRTLLLCHIFTTIDN
jgi:hypothetical protein